MKLVNTFKVLAISVISAVSILSILPQKATAAGGWSTLESSYGGSLIACQYTEYGGYGPVWHLRVGLANGSPSYASASLRIARGTQTVSSTSMGAASGQWAWRDMYASQIYNDVLTGSASFAPGTGGGFTISPSNIASCY